MGRLKRFLVQMSSATVCAVAFGGTTAAGQTAQEHIHAMGQTVMLFDLNKATHFFRMTDSGGVESIVVKDVPDLDHVELTRQHLRHEAEAFQRGDYADPLSLHSATMPGVSELGSHHAEITVSYSELPLGAALTCRTHDRHLVTAIHRWFGVQLSEHGADARPFACHRCCFRTTPKLQRLLSLLRADGHNGRRGEVLPEVTRDLLG